MKLTLLEANALKGQLKGETRALDLKVAESSNAGAECKCNGDLHKLHFS